VYGYWDEYSASGQAEGRGGDLEYVPVHRETAADFRLVRFSGYLHFGEICFAGMDEFRERR
jgi:hypothetical protein